MAMEAADRDQALATKIICLVLFGVISLGCGLLPLIASRVARCWRRSRTGKTEVRVSGRVRVMLSCVLCLGGGVLLGTVFTHMLPEVREIFLKIEGADLLPGMHPPAGEIFICAGFFLVYMVEELVHAFLAGRASAKKKRHVAPAPAVSSPSSSVVVEVHGDRDAMSWHEKYAEPASSPVVAMSPVTTADLSEPDHAGHDHGSVVATLHALRAYIVIVALSVHSVFEGFAVAFEATSRDVWILFAAIATHKAIVAFCLGEQLLATKRSACFVVTNLVILSAASPLGVTIGLAVEQLDQDEGSRLLATGLLQALAAGTILYVVFFEILAPERQKHGAGLLKFLAVVAGFSLIVLMHSSGGGHSHGGPAHELPPGVHVHAGEVDTHAHDHAHSAAETVNSDYLARVPNESGHVYNTVRYIKSFSRQEPPTVDTVDIVAGMRSIVEDLGGSAHEHDHEHAHENGHEHAHGEDPHGEDGHGGEASADSIPASSKEGADSGGKQLIPQLRDGDHPDDHGDHIGHDDHVHHDDHDHDPHDERDGHGPSAPGAASGESRSTSGEEEEGTHHHDHDQFMRTVADLAGRLGGLDRRAVDRTVTLIDTLDLIAMQKTDRKAKSRGKATAKPTAGKNSHNHDQDNDHEHEHDHGDNHGSPIDIPSSPSSAPEAPSPSAPGAAPGVAEPSGTGAAERQWLHAAHFGEPFDSHVQFVLQEPEPEASQARDVSPAPAPTQTAGPSTSTDVPSSSTRAPSSTGVPTSTSTSTLVPSAGETARQLDAALALEEVEEVRFHDQSSDGDREHVHETTHAPP